MFIFLFNKNRAIHSNFIINYVLLSVFLLTKCNDWFTMVCMAGIIPHDKELIFDKPETALAYKIAITTSLRVSEIVGLRIEQFVDRMNFINIKVKGGRVCAVPFPDWLLDEIILFCGDRTVGWLFCQKKNYKKPWGRTYLSAEFKKAAVNAGLPNIRFHDLRHTAITRFQEKTNDLVMTRDFARHTNIRTTSRYLHANPLKILEAMENT